MGSKENDSKMLPEQEYLESAGKIGCDLVRAMGDVTGCVGEIGEDELPDQVRQKLFNLHNIGKLYYSTFFPGYFDNHYLSQYRLSQNFDILLGYARDNIPDFSWAGSGAESWRKHHLQMRPRSIMRIVNELMDDMGLPESLIVPLLSKYSDSTIYAILSAPIDKPGMRFLPGFRKLEWGKDPDGYLAVYGMDRTEGKMVLETPSGQQFFIASTAGWAGLERLFSRENLNLKLKGASENKQPKNIPYVLFDINGTLDDSSEDRQERNRNVEIRKKALLDLQKKGIQMGLWSRNPADVVTRFAEEIYLETGIKLSPKISFDHWPFVDWTVINFTYRNGPQYKLDIWPVTRIQEVIQNQLSKLDPLRSSENAAQQIFDFLQLYRDYIILESKAPNLLALWEKNLSNQEREALYWSGVMVNNDTNNLVSAVHFGHSFIYLTEPQQLEMLARLI
jgi:hypothetical protein